MAKQIVERKVTANITIKDAKMIFRNFSGKQTDFNEKGNRNFGVLLDDDLAEDLENDGWNVKRLKPREDSERPDYEQPWLPVKVKFDPYSPIVVLITSAGKCKLDEETVSQLDWTRMKTVDLIIRPYNYPARNGRPAGVSAYLKSIYVTVNEDELEEKYADIPWLSDHINRNVDLEEEDED